MSNRVFVWREPHAGPTSGAFGRLDGVDCVELDWSEALEAFVPVGRETALHLSEAGDLDGEWLIFLGDAFSTNEYALAVMLDYARYYGLRTAAIFASGAARPESIALDAILLHADCDANALREAWRNHGLDLDFAPPVLTVAADARTVDVLERLNALPAIASMLVLEGGRAAPVNVARIALRTLKWNEAQSALEPINADAFLPARDFTERWALLPMVSCRDGAEAMAIVDEAKGLGLHVAIDVGDYALDPHYGRLPLDGADIVFFRTDERRDAALADAFRHDEKIALLRERWRVAADHTAMIAEIGRRRARLNKSRLLARPVQIDFVSSSKAADGLRESFENIGLRVGGQNADWKVIYLDGGDVTNSSLKETIPGSGKIAAIVDVEGEEAIAAILNTLSGADVILPTRWSVAAQLIRAFALAGQGAQKIVPCPLARTAQGAVDWRAYAESIVEILARAGATAGWPLAAIIRQPDQPLLTCAITTYNRAPWLRHSLKSLLDAAAPWRDRVEVLVCDNASTDDTQRVAEELLQTYDFSYHRNAVNVGMLGNLGATARYCRGAYVWVIGDDDLVVPEGLEIILDSIEKHPDVEMVYLNYAYTRFNDPASLSDARGLIERATPIGFGGADRYAKRLADIAAFNENLFTAIYACVFRRDHALRAYQLDTRGPPFSSLPTCVPSSVYTLSALPDRPAFWVGFPAIVVNMNVSWMRWAILWHLERMPDLFDMAELAGIDPDRLDRHRYKHCWNAGGWLREALFDSEDAIRAGASVARLIERCKHLEVFRSGEGAKIMEAYGEAWGAGRVVADQDPPEAVSTRYGLPPLPKIACVDKKL